MSSHECFGDGSAAGEADLSLFDQLTAMAATLFGTQAALVSITEGHRQIFRSRLGVGGVETPSESAFTPHAVALGEGGVLVVEDASLDERFKDNVHVTGPAHVRFYAGAVITLKDGRDVGCVCVLDQNPRPRPDDAKLEALRRLARLAADMLEKREAAGGAREKLEMLDMAEAMSGVGHWRLDVATGRVTWSDQVYHIHGLDPDVFDPNLDSAVDAYHPEDRDAIRRAIERAAETGEPYDVRLRLIHTDGTMRLVRSRGVAQRDETGRVEALFGVFQDITEQEAVLASARKNEHRYRLLADNMADVIARVKPDGHSNYISPAAEAVIGYTPLEMVGTTAQDYVLEADKPIFLNAMAQVLETGENRRVQYRVAHKSGVHVWVETHLQRVENSRGQGEVVIVIRDISDRKALEDEVAASLAESRKIADRYRLLAENMGDVITRVKADGTSKYISTAIEQLLGWGYHEMSGQSLDYVHPADRGIVLEAIQEAIRDGKPRTLQHRAVHRDGRPIWLESHFRAMSDESRALGEAVVVMRDISDRKALEAELMAARDRAEAAARAKSEFLANMSHELRTPLTSVVGFAGLLKQSPNLAADERRYAERIASGSEALLAVINDILDYSKLEAGAVELDPQPFSPADLARGAADLMEAQCRAKGLMLELEVEPDMPERLMGDSGRLRQVLLNFLSNAVKFTANGGVRVAVSCEPDADGRVWMALSVKDSGIGISEDMVEQLFDRFTQADASTTRTFGGTGLGLAISRQLIEMMGGEIGAHGTPGEGSTFWFQVPLAVCEAPREDAAPAAAQTLTAARILMADDAPANRELVSVLLRGMGLSVDTVENGAEAVEAVRQDR